MNLKKYTRLIEWSDEDQCYLGSLPELLEGRCCHGDSVEEVTRHLDECEELALEVLAEEPQRGVQVFVPARKRNWINSNSIATLRASFGLSQQEFASRIGASLSTLQKWERGERKPSGSSAKLLEVVSKHPEVL